MATPTIAHVVLPLPLDKVYDYAVPPEWQQAVQPGSRVIVPFGARTLTGYVVGLESRPAGEAGGRALKPLADVIDPEPLLTPEAIAFCRSLAEYYLCSWGEALKAALPPAINATAQCHFELNPDTETRLPVRLTPNREYILARVAANAPVSKAQLAREMGSRPFVLDLDTLVRARWITARTVVGGGRSRGLEKKVISLVPPVDEEGWERLQAHGRRAPRQGALLALLRSRPEPVERAELSALGYGSGVIQGLLDAGFAAQTLVPDTAEDSYDTDHSVRGLVLGDEQAAAVERIAGFIRKPRDPARRHRAFLLHGITGSGKTQVYLELARRARRLGLSVLVLVPEISLTPQIVARFRAFLGSDVAVIHSRLGSAQRFSLWRDIRAGRIRSVVGARSALFAPLQDLGLIVVDEEHEGSFKQFEPQPRYHARDAALMRGAALGIPVILGSATPSLESWFNAEQGKFERITLANRVSDRPLPEVQLVDMKETLEQIAGKGRTVRAFGDSLIKSLVATVQQGEKAIVLQNRRGYSPWIQCDTCREALRCVRCDISLTWHRTDNRCHCHLCGLSIPVPPRCPACRDGTLLLLGSGTQKVEEELEEMFPDARVMRMDRDTTAGRDAYVKMVRDFNSGSYDILLGTKSVAKGLDFSAVTLVGVINADTELNLQDFRAQEWGYQLVSQVAGRAGRGEKPGTVVVQSFAPEHPVLQDAARHDFQAFAARELEQRRSLGYPPFGRLCRLVVKSLDETLCANTCEALHGWLAERRGPVQLLGPGPAPVRQVRREFRYQIVLKSPRAADPGGRLMRALALSARQQFDSRLRSKDLSLVIDVDPQSLM